MSLNQRKGPSQMKLQASKFTLSAVITHWCQTDLHNTIPASVFCLHHTNRKSHEEQRVLLSLLKNTVLTGNYKNKLETWQRLAVSVWRKAARNRLRRIYSRSAESQESYRNKTLLNLSVSTGCASCEGPANVQLIEWCDVNLYDVTESQACWLCSDQYHITCA